MADENVQIPGQVRPSAGTTKAEKTSPNFPDGLNGVLPQPSVASPGLFRRVKNFLYPKHEGAGHQADGMREVVETVVFVVVLVLMLKSFAAEAFVIPTGSMAETLYGYQANVTCPECGTKFPVNFSNVVDPQGGSPQAVLSCMCPNCRFPIELPKGLFKNGEEYPAKDGVDGDRALKIEIEKAETGDRVLVAKFWTKSFFGLAPDRFDVVVFKYPKEPQKQATPQNYIKRLIGLGGETIGIHRGKLYRLPPEEPSPFNDLQSEPKPRDWDLWQSMYMHEDNKEMIERLREGKGFHILQKPAKTVLAEMRLVYDNDHPAKDMKDYPRWVGDKTAWTPVEGNGFAHQGTDSKNIDFLRYGHRLREPKMGERQLITDFMGYNSATYHDINRTIPGQNWVSDLIVEAEVDIQQATGDLVLELSKGPERFQARWELSTGVCSLFRVKNGDKGEKLASKPTNVKKGSYRLRFANVDNRLLVWVDNRLPFGEFEVTYEPEKVLVPDEKNDLEPASIGVRGAAVSVQHLKLYRDTYYTCKGRDPDVNVSDWADSSQWSKFADMPYKTFYVQPDHYLCLGDNSPESSDGRSWGLVPERLMLGRALLVYWPFGRAGRIR
jgi:signal peptidase I